MPNQLEQQILNNLAVKAGQNSFQDPVKPGGAIAPVRVSPSEEEMLINLIHLKDTLYPEKAKGKACKFQENHTSEHMPLPGR